MRHSKFYKSCLSSYDNPVAKSLKYLTIIKCTCEMKHFSDSNWLQYFSKLKYITIDARTKRNVIFKKLITILFFKSNEFPLKL